MAQTIWAITSLKTCHVLIGMPLFYYGLTQMQRNTIAHICFEEYCELQMK